MVEIVDRFKLYFHSLNKDQDLLKPLSITKNVYDASQAYQKFEAEDVYGKNEVK